MPVVWGIVVVGLLMLQESWESVPGTRWAHKPMEHNKQHVMWFPDFFLYSKNSGSNWYLKQKSLKFWTFWLLNHFSNVASSRDMTILWNEVRKFQRKCVCRSRSSSQSECVRVCHPFVCKSLCHHLGSFSFLYFRNSVHMRYNAVLFYFGNISIYIGGIDVILKQTT